VTIYILLSVLIVVGLGLSFFFDAKAGRENHVVNHRLSAIAFAVALLSAIGICLAVIIS